MPRSVGHILVGRTDCCSMGALTCPAKGKFQSLVARRRFGIPNSERRVCRGTPLREVTRPKAQARYHYRGGRQRSMSAVRLNVNGRDCDVAGDPAASLLSVLRDELHLTGAKPGYGEGQLSRDPNPTVDEIRTGLDANLCRCGTYPRIIKAVRRAAQGGKRA
jgi:hypothetical protein